MHEERFAELLELLHIYISNRPEVKLQPDFDAEKWLATWVEEKNERLCGDRPSDLFESSDGFDEVQSRLREVVRSWAS